MLPALEGCEVSSGAANKMSAYRRRLREQGLRPIQIWVPDLRDPARRERLRRDVQSLRGHPSDAEGNAFLDAALAEIEGWEG
jgi:hypothetical protein